MNSSTIFLQRNFIRNVYGIFRKSESLQNISIQVISRDNFHTLTPVENGVLDLKRCSSSNSVAEYHNPVIQYYQERKRFFNSKLQDKVSETVDRRSLVGCDNATIKNNLNIIGKLPGGRQRSLPEDDSMSLRDCLVECKAERSVKEPAPVARMKQPLLKKEYYMEPYKNASDDDRCDRLSLKYFPVKSTVDDDARSLTLSIKDAMIRKQRNADIFHVPEKLRMKHIPEDARSLTISLSSYKGARMNTKDYIMKPPNTNINKEIIKRIQKNKKQSRKKNLSESDLYDKLKKITSKQHKDFDSVSANLTIKEDKANPFMNLKGKHDLLKRHKQSSTKQFLKQIPLPDVQPLQKPYRFLVPSQGKKSPALGTYPWNELSSKNNYTGYGLQPTSVTNITKHLITKKSKTATKKEKKKKKSAVQLYQNIIGVGENEAPEEEPSENVRNIVTPKNFISKIMNIYKNKKCNS